VRATGAVLALARSELRRHWRALVVLGLLAGVVGGAVTSATALARRTSTAHDRLRVATNIDDVRVSVFLKPRWVADLFTALPNVNRSLVSPGMIAAVEGRHVLYTGIQTLPGHDIDVARPIFVEGRAPADDAVDEVAIIEPYARASDVRLGEKRALTLFTANDARSFSNGVVRPHGARVVVRVVGIARTPTDADTSAPLIASHAFAERYRSWAIAWSVFLQLRHGAADIPQFKADVDALSKRVPELGPGQSFQPYEEAFPGDGNASAADTARVLVAGVAVFAIVGGLVGLFAVTQGFARHHASGAARQQVEAAIGLTPFDRTIGRVIPAALAAGIAAVLTAIAATASGLFEPLGAMRRREPFPGWAPNITIIVAGALLTALVVLLVAAITAHRAGRRAATADDASGSFVPIGALAQRAWLLAGFSFALRRGRVVRAALAGTAIGVAGLVAAGTFTASLHRLEKTPQRWGWQGDFAIQDVTDPVVAQLRNDARIASISVARSATVRVEDVAVTGSAVEQAKGYVGWTMLRGHAPGTPDEIAIGSRLARRFGVDVGDHVRVRLAFGGDAHLLVSGITVGPALNSDHLGNDVLLTRQGLGRLRTSDAYTEGLVDVRDGVDGQAVATEYARDLEVSFREPPAEVENLIELGQLPETLGAFLAVIAASALAHALFVTTKRRARDLGVLRSLGFTPREAAQTVASMAAVAAIVGLLAGIPLGLGVGRLVWWAVADATGIATDARPPVLLLVTLVPAMLVGAVLVALVPARRAARLQAAVVLRSE
jgi:ABC-type lipoprotein release transport system permease subunit